jgi:branched-chain amino acid transport system ATP-binding protein
MDALQSLAADHRLIRRTLEAFELYVGYVEARLTVDRSDLGRFVDFFESYADVYHHGKEEALLFPALVMAGLDWNDDPLARIRREHDQEHYLMRTLAHAGLQNEVWSDDDRRHFLAMAKEFIGFEGDHMRFENLEVFPRAERVLSEHARLRLTRDVERYDETCTSENRRMTELAETLRRRYSLNDFSRCQGASRVEPRLEEPR